VETEAKERIFVALDVDSLEKAGPLVEQLSPYVGCFKVGLELLTSAGAPQTVDFIHNLGGRIFFDGKFMDIPNTVAGAARAAAKMTVEIFNVHCLGGLKMMMAARGAAEEAVTCAQRPLILGVTILTSLNYDDLKRLGFREKSVIENSRSLEELKNESVKELVVHLAQLAQASGLDGVIASAKEIEAIRSVCRPDFMIVTPGIRPTWAATGDQKRVTTPFEAIKAGADYLVIGRPILEPPEEIGSPVEAAKRIAEEINSAL
jgi:orotidine-5'-phosphate decarboxylase